MNLTEFDKIKLEYQTLSDTEKFTQFAKSYPVARNINVFRTAESYWSTPFESDKNCSNLFQYYFPVFYEYMEECKKIFTMYGLPQAELYALICTVTAYRRQPHVMLLWERRRAHGLKDDTLNTHELFGNVGSGLSEIEKMLGEGKNFEFEAEDVVEPQKQVEWNAIPDDLRYTVF